MKRTLYSLAFVTLTVGYIENNKISAQSVTTHAGVQYTDSGRYLGTADNPKATELYSRPNGVAVDINGRIWVTDEHNIMLLDGGTSRNRGGYRGDPNGVDALGYFDGVGPVSRFTYPTGLAVHPTANDVYICDRDNSSIRKASKFVNSSSGTIFSTYAGYSDWTGGYKDGSLTDARFRFPEDAQFDANGILYIADQGNHCIRKIASGQVTTLAGDGSQSPGFADGTGKDARFSYPAGIGMDSNGDLLVADRNNRRIRRINTATGAVTTVTDKVGVPYDVIGINGKIYILEATCIKVFDGTNVSVLVGSASQAGYKDGSYTDARFRQMYHFDYNPKDECLYVADYGNNVIRRIPLLNEATASFYANNTTPIVNQTVVLTSSSQNYASLKWEITPNTYTLQAGSTLSDRVVYVSFSNATSYTVKLTATNPSGQDIEAKDNYINVSTNSLAKPEADFIASNTFPLLNDELVNLVDLSANNPTSHQWTITPSTYTFQNGTDENSRNPSLKFNALGLYTISLLVENSYGNSSVSKTSYIQVVGLNTDQNESNKVAFYPNPSNGRIHFKGVNAGDQVRVFDLFGRLVFADKVNDENIVDMPLNAGVYFVNVLKIDRWISLGKLIIE